MSDKPTKTLWGFPVAVTNAPPPATAFLIPGPMPTRATEAIDAERWAHGVWQFQFKVQP